MHEWELQALGTRWIITTDKTPLALADKDAVVAWLTNYEARFSRFRFDSEVNAFREAVAGKYEVSNTLAELLALADKLRRLTAGRFDPAVGALLEEAGYNADYSFQEQGNVAEVVVSSWSLIGTTLTLNGPIKFDLGGIGKGYAIDQVATLLTERGYLYFNIDAGGDLFGTTKADGTPWRTAIEYPGQPDMAIGVVDLAHQAVAVSDVVRRKWGKWHHLIDVKSKDTVKEIISAVAVAPQAVLADAMTSALFFNTERDYQTAANLFQAHYLVVHTDGTATYDSSWPGNLFVR